MRLLISIRENGQVVLRPFFKCMLLLLIDLGLCTNAFARTKAETDLIVKYKCYEKKTKTEQSKCYDELKKELGKLSQSNKSEGVSKLMTDYSNQREKEERPNKENFIKNQLKVIGCPSIIKRVEGLDAYTVMTENRNYYLQQCHSEAKERLLNELRAKNCNKTINSVEKSTQVLDLKNKHRWLQECEEELFPANRDSKVNIPTSVNSQ